MPALVNTETIIFLSSFFFSATACRLGLCNHLGENRGAEGETLSECSLTMITVSKASV